MEWRVGGIIELCCSFNSGSEAGLELCVTLTTGALPSDVSGIISDSIQFETSLEEVGTFACT